MNKDYDEGFLSGAQSVLSWLSEIYEDIHMTDVWAEYMGEDEDA